MPGAWFGQFSTVFSTGSGCHRKYVRSGQLQCLLPYRLGIWIPVFNGINLVGNLIARDMQGYLVITYDIPRKGHFRVSKALQHQRLIRATHVLHHALHADKEEVKPVHFRGKASQLVDLGDDHAQRALDHSKRHGRLTERQTAAIQRTRITDKNQHTRGACYSDVHMVEPCRRCCSD